MSEANAITAGLLEELPKRYRFMRVWRNNRVKTMAIGRGGQPRMISAGVDGQADISGILAVPTPGGLIGIRLEIEVKAGKDKQSDAQKNFQRMIEGFGGIYILARGVDSALADIENARIYSMSVLRGQTLCKACHEQTDSYLSKAKRKHQ